MRLPGQVGVEPRFPEQAVQVAVGSEKDVQAALQPVAIRVLPGGDLAAGMRPLLQHRHLMARVGQILGGR